MSPKERVARGGGSGHKRVKQNPNPVVPNDPTPPNANLPYMGLTQLTTSQKKKWRNLEGRKVQVTNFLDLETVRGLGLDALVTDLMAHAGLRNFFGKRATTYKRYTLEFLSTLEILKEEGTTKIRFNLDDITFGVSYEKLREVFGVDEPRGVWLENDGAGEFFFHELTGLTYRKKHIRANSLPHPAWKLFYKELSMTWMGNGEPAQLNLAMVNLLRVGLQSVRVIPDWIDIFVHRCASFSLSDKGNISVGGMITLLADACVEELSPEAIKLDGLGLYTREWLIQYDKFARNPDSRDFRSLLFEYGDLPKRTVFCGAGANFPNGVQARHWRMPGIEDVNEPNDKEEEEREGQGHLGQEQHQNQQGPLDPWTQIKAYMDEQERSRIAREQSRHALEDVRWEEVRDRLEGLEDEAAISRAQYRQLETWATQTEPRHYEPVSETYLALMHSRATARAQRHSSRQTYYQGNDFSSHQ